MLAVLALMALRCLPSELADGRLVPEIVSFVPWLFAPIAVCLVLAALWRRWLLLVVSGTALAVMLWWHAGYLLPGARVSDAAVVTAQTTADASDNVARAMIVSTRATAAPPPRRESWRSCATSTFEILCLQELTDDFITALWNARHRRVPAALR